MIDCQEVLEAFADYLGEPDMKDHIEPFLDEYSDADDDEDEEEDE